MSLSQHYQVLVLAAGKGTRFRSETPKVLHRVLGLTLLERVIRSIRELKPTQVTVVVGTGKERVEAELAEIGERYKLPIKTVFQAEQRGTGDAVRVAIPEIKKQKERILIIPGDTPLLTAETIREISSLDIKSGNPDLAVISCEPSSPAGYGRIVRSGDGTFLKIVEDKDCTPTEKNIREINAALYCSSVSFVEEAVKELQPNNAQGELYFTDTAAWGIRAGKKVLALCISNWMDFAGANTRAELAALEIEARRRVNTRVMNEGATLQNPENIYIEEDVQIGKDVYLGTGTRLYGKTILEDDVRVDGDTLVTDSVIKNGTHVKFGSMIEESLVGERCVIGPFAHLRPKSELSQDVHIGNFVETKASKIGKGTKANHLTYIGDSIVGEKVNFGAGTITANYDGYKKHQTKVGSGASTGSNSVLVAPVEIGDGAYVGAGSVITKNVPEDSLAVSRGQERVIPEWAKKRREKFSKEK